MELKCGVGPSISSLHNTTRHHYTTHKQILCETAQQTSTRGWVVISVDVTKPFVTVTLSQYTSSQMVFVWSQWTGSDLCVWTWSSLETLLDFINNWVKNRKLWCILYRTDYFIPEKDTTVSLNIGSHPYYRGTFVSFSSSRDIGFVF